MLIPRHHPCAADLAAYVADSLRPGARLVVSSHLSFCAVCRAEVAMLESLSGRSAPRPTADEPAGGAGEQTLESAALPAALEGLRLGRRRWLGPGLTLTPVLNTRARRERVYLLRVAAGRRIERHSHHGAERVCVLEGVVEDGGRFRPGDFIARDGGAPHSPRAGPNGPCICLVATDNPVRFSRLIPRLVQGLAGC